MKYALWGFKDRETDIGRIFESVLDRQRTIFITGTIGIRYIIPRTIRKYRSLWIFSGVLDSWEFCTSHGCSAKYNIRTFQENNGQFAIGTWKSRITCLSFYSPSSLSDIQTSLIVIFIVCSIFPSSSCLCVWCCVHGRLAKDVVRIWYWWINCCMCLVG